MRIKIPFTTVKMPDIEALSVENRAHIMRVYFSSRKARLFTRFIEIGFLMAIICSIIASKSSGVIRILFWIFAPLFVALGIVSYRFSTRRELRNIIGSMEWDSLENPAASVMANPEEPTRPGMPTQTSGAGVGGAGKYVADVKRTFLYIACFTVIALFAFSAAVVFRFVLLGVALKVGVIFSALCMIISSMAVQNRCSHFKNLLNEHASSTIYLNFFIEIFRKYISLFDGFILLLAILGDAIFVYGSLVL